ncbi:hypothetical protein JHK87_055860 [Glycine soja]|nr:hypothetical protein JHK87_055860 [Glycine soja]
MITQGDFLVHFMDIARDDLAKNLALCTIAAVANPCHEGLTCVVVHWPLSIVLSPYNGQDLGTGFTPPYLSPSTIGPIVLKGVNYASGGGGIFVTIMISKLKVHLIRLFNLGGRKFVVANVGPTGCIPNQKDINKAEIYFIKLSGDPKLGEGKPENQNHAIVFTRGEAVQTIGMNQVLYIVLQWTN